MSEMVERVARALKDFNTRWLLEAGSGNPSGPDYRKAMARAAIVAMREPSEAMSDAIGQEMDAYLGAVDAALKD